MNRSQPRRRPGVAETGSALLEALIAILIFSFGVLGLIGILAGSIRAANGARYRPDAPNPAQGLIGDMWSAAGEDVDAQNGTGGAKLTAWQTQVANLLPSATGANLPVVDLT